MIKLFLIGIFGLSLFLRLYRLDLNIPNIYSDEAWHYFIQNQIKECNVGQFQCLNQIIYFGSYSATWLFGLTPLGVRLFSAVYGSFIPVLIFFFSLAVSKKRSVAVGSALIAAVAPWSFMISRFGHTQIPILVNLILLHLFFLFKKRSLQMLSLSLIFLVMAVFYYQSMVVIFPFAMLGVGLNYFPLTNRGNRKWVFLLGMAFVLLVEFLAVSRFSVSSVQGRALDLAIWRDVNTTYEIDKLRAFSDNKLIYNRAIANVTIFTRNYLSFFSPDWLILKGDPILRHSTGQVGAFYPFLLPIMLFGAFKFFQTTDRKKKLTFLVWILVSPIPAAITKDGAGYLLRVVTMLPFLTYFCALGLAESFNLVKRGWRWPYGFLLALIGLYSAYYFIFGYFHVYPALSARAYEYGFKELSDFQVAHGNRTMLIVWDGYYHDKDFRFWQKTPFGQRQNFKQNRLSYGTSVFWHTFDNLYFTSPTSVTDLESFLSENPITYVVLPDRYFVKYPEEIIELLTPEEEIKYPDQTTAFTVFTPKGGSKTVVR